MVGLRDKLNFFETKPLFGKNVIVTRSRTQSSSLVSKISDLGGNPIEVPTIKIDKIENNIALENEIKNIKDYTYLILTSKNAVDIFFDSVCVCNVSQCEDSVQVDTRQGRSYRRSSGWYQ